MLSTKLLTLTLVAGAAATIAACRGSNGARSTEARASTLATDSLRTPTTGDTALIRQADHARIEGSATAPLWVVEVSDFQCPYCRQWHEATYPVIKKEYVDTGKIRLAYINFPLPGHQNAWPAAEAAMCAATQGKFWEMHDALFATQTEWERSGTPAAIFDSLATKVGVNLDPYHDCISKHAMRPLIQADVERATESGVNSTPTFLIGNTMIQGAQPASVFRETIDSALAKAKTS
jgi:protein-disulfide isomerase